MNPLSIFFGKFRKKLRFGKNKITKNYLMKGDKGEKGPKRGKTPRIDRGLER
jgi:hypothetical protein